MTNNCRKPLFVFLCDLCGLNITAPEPRPFGAGKNAKDRKRDVLYEVSNRIVRTSLLERPLGSVAVILAVWVLSLNHLGAQTMPQQDPRMAMLTNQQSVSGGIGVTVIDGKPYYLFNIMPDLSFGKWGIGLDVNLRVGQDGKIRQGDFKDGYSYLRLLRYIRYGQKNENVYARVGALDFARIGHGSIIYLYRNTASYDLRKVGVEFDLDFQKGGLESMYSDVAGAGVLGLRGYVRPLQFGQGASSPILGNLEVGATFASDFNSKANRTWGDPAGTIRNAEGGGVLSIVGLDVGLPLLSHEYIGSTLYADYAKILSYGSGTAVGLNLRLRGLGLVTLDAKYERRFVGNQYLPTYFDAFYEHDRYQVIDTSRFMSKAQILKSTQSFEGYFGEVLVSILGTLNIVGGYQAPVGVKNAGTLHLMLDVGDALPGILVSGGYDKKNVGSIFKLDNNSLLYAQVGYKPAPYLVVSMLYQWTYTEIRDEQSGQVVGFKPQKRIEPRVGFIARF